MTANFSAVNLQLLLSLGDYKNTEGVLCIFKKSF